MPKRKARTVSGDPILQDCNITSASNIDTEVSYPSDTSFEKKMETYEVLDHDLNQSPPCSQMHNLDEVSKVPESLDSPFKIPFQPKNARNCRPSLFDSILNYSEPNTPDLSATSEHFKRKCPGKEISFSISSSDDSISNNLNSRQKPKFVKKQTTRSKAYVEDNIFYSDLDESVNKSKLPSCDANNSFQKQTRKSTIANYNRKKLCVNNSGIFDSDLDSSNMTGNLSNVNTLIESIDEENVSSHENITARKKKSKKPTCLPKFLTKSKTTIRQDIANNTFDSIICNESSDVLSSKSNTGLQSTLSGKELPLAAADKANNLSVRKSPRLPFVKTTNGQDEVNEDIFNSDFEASDISLHSATLTKNNITNGNSSNTKTISQSPIVKAKNYFNEVNAGIFDSDLEASNTSLQCAHRDGSQYNKIDTSTKSGNSTSILINEKEPDKALFSVESPRAFRFQGVDTSQEDTPNHLIVGESCGDDFPTKVIDKLSSYCGLPLDDNQEAIEPSKSSLRRGTSLDKCIGKELPLAAADKANNLSVRKSPRLPFVKTTNGQDEVNEDIFNSDFEASDISLHSATLTKNNITNGNSSNTKTISQPPFVKAKNDFNEVNAGIFDSDLEASNTSLQCAHRDGSQYNKIDTSTKSGSSTSILVNEKEPDKALFSVESSRALRFQGVDTSQEDAPNHLIVGESCGNDFPTQVIDKLSSYCGQPLDDNQEAIKPSKSSLRRGTSLDKCIGKFSKSKGVNAINDRSEQRNQITMKETINSTVSNYLNISPVADKSRTSLCKRVSFRIDEINVCTTPASVTDTDCYVRQVEHNSTTSLDPLVYDDSSATLNRDSVYIDIHASRIRNSGSSVNSNSENQLVNSNHTVEDDDSSENIQSSEQRKSYGEKSDSDHLNYENTESSAVGSAVGEFGEETDYNNCVEDEETSENIQITEHRKSYVEKSDSDHIDEGNTESSAVGSDIGEFGEETEDENGENITTDYRDKDNSYNNMSGDDNEHNKENYSGDSNDDDDEEDINYWNNNTLSKTLLHSDVTVERPFECGNKQNKKYATGNTISNDEGESPQNRNVYKEYESFLRNDHDNENLFPHTAQAGRQHRTNTIIFKKPLPKKLSKSRTRNILENLAYSELKTKTRRAPEANREQTLHNEIEESLRKRKKQQPAVTKLNNGKLKKPKKWVSSSLYELIINKLKPKYGVNSRVQAEKLVVYLVTQVDKVLKIQDLSFFSVVEEMKLKLASLRVIQTHFDFRELVMKYFDAPFSHKVYPFRGDVSNPFEPENMFEVIPVEV